jgi:hypothetical protein
VDERLENEDAEHDNRTTCLARRGREKRACVQSRKT